MMFTRNYLALFLALFILLSICKESTQKIPANIWMNIHNTKEFIEKLLRKKGHGHPGEPRPPGIPEQEIPMEDVIYTQEGSLIPGASVAVSDMLASEQTVQEDRCETKTISVPVPAHPDPNVIYWPSCVKLHQCSGCCNNEMLECAPIIIQGVEMKVLRARYPYSGADYFEFEGVHSVLFERHLECECRCKIQMTDCDLSKQIYDKHSCLCRCNNEQDAMGCIHPKIWSNKNCACECPSQVRECYDDEVYDHLSCSCERNTVIPDPIRVPSIRPCEKYCRYGFEGQWVNDVCTCVLATRLKEGSLIGSHSPVTRPPVVPLPKLDHVPGGRPQLISYHADTITTSTPRPTRRPRRPRRPRRGRRLN